MERIPKGKPVILAANHPTAFIEPCIVGCWMDGPLNFLARGDLYVKSKFVRRLYEWFHIVPVFRLDDMGYGALKTNYETFGKCYEALHENKRVMILAEGRCIHEKRLRPLMKGTARIVFGAWEKYPDLDIHVVPVGVNYTNPDQFRSEVKIDFGEPIRAMDYKETYLQNQSKAVNALTTDLREKLLERVIHLENPAEDEWKEPMLDIYRNELSAKIFPHLSADEKLLFQEKNFANRLNTLSDFVKNEVKEKVKSYLNLLAKSGTNDRGLVDHTSYSVGSALLLGLGWIPYMVGYLLNILPLKLGHSFAKKKTKNIEFRASVAIFVTMAIYIIYLLLLFVAALIIGKWWAVSLVLVTPFLGYFAVLYHDLDIRWKSCQCASVMDDATEEQLLKMRKELMSVAVDNS